MIDPRIPMLGQSPDMVGAVNSGLADGSNFAKLLIGSQVNRMRDIEDPTQRQAFANKNFFGRQLREQLKADAAAKVKAEQDALKFKSDLNNTDAQAAERLANAGSTNQKTGASRHGATLDVWRAAATNPSYGKVMLNNLLNAGAITQEVFDGTNNQLSVLEGASPAQAKEIIDNQIQAMLDPKYKYADANTIANNETSIKTTGMNNATTMRGQDITAETAANKLAQDGEQFQQNFEHNAQQDEIKNGQAEIKEFGGKAYIVYKNGQFKPAIGADGKQLLSAKSETPIQKIERQEKALGYADSAKSAADASVLAANLANDLKGINSTAGGFGILAKIPGSPQRTYASKIETLKSQVFLNQIAKMRGLGALTDAEGARLEKSIASLDINLDPKTLQANLSDISKTMSQVAVRMNKTTKIYTGREGKPQQPLFDSSSYVD